jgi:hypothetical protein
VFFIEGRRERGRVRRRRRRRRKRGTTSPLKQILVILALVIYKILKKILVL